jgi:hypothetical protein
VKALPGLGFPGGQVFAAFLRHRADDPRIRALLDEIRSAMRPRDA